MNGIPGGIFAKRSRRQMKGTQTRSRIVLGRSTSCSVASIAQDNTAYDRALSSKIRVYRQRARADKPAKHKSTVFKDADVDDDIDGMNAGHYGAEDGFDFRDFKRIVVAEMPVASERFRKAMDAQRTNRLSATNNRTSAAATNAHSNDGVYVAEAGGAVTDRITAQDSIPEDNGASSTRNNTKCRAELAGDSAGGDGQPIEEATVFRDSVSQDLRKNSPSNADEKVPRTKGVNTKRAKVGLATRVARNEPQAAQPIDNTTEDTSPRTRARTKATQPDNPTVGATATVLTDAPAASTAPANPTSARVRKPVRKTRQKTVQAPVAPPPVTAPPAEPADPSKTRTLRSKRTCALEVPKPKPRTRRMAQQTGALSSEEAGKLKRKPTAGQKRRRDDDDAETPAPTKRRKPAH
ncbi:hypothetical protein DFH11DRAFT_1550552 [Phellopilus nigrolimitatus]|nr:hypothetical protein DFH11DRAFT_1550552 [Phellopilus nigrolimitatus]